MHQEVEITIINWEKYNPTEMQTKTPYWFRVQNTIHRSESLCGLSKTDKWHWICLLSIASQKKSGQFTCDLRWICSELTSDLRWISKTLQRLSRKNLITFVLKTPPETPSRVRSQLHATLHNNTIHNKEDRSARVKDQDSPLEVSKQPVVIPPGDVAIAPPKNPVQGLVGVYVKAWQEKYKTKARPDVGPKAVSCLRRLVEGGRSPQEVADMLQVYLQMQNDWFDTKRHDLVTFEANANVIALALDKGNDLHMDWDYIFSKGQSHGSKSLPSSN